MDAAVEVLIDTLAEVAAGPRPLVVGMAEPRLVVALAAAGGVPDVWSRRAAPGIVAAPWPPDGPCSSALLRLPKAKAELDFVLDAAATVTGPGAPLLLVGGNDEGIRSAAARLARFADGVETIAARRHCRVLAGRRRQMPDGLVGRLAGWRHVASIDLGQGPRPWVSYPGLFAGGRLDDGTALLLANLPPLAPAARVLDFAAGTGTIAAGVLQAVPTARIVMLDHDAAAIAAARENVPGAAAILGDRLATAGPDALDLIISNPPIHDGIAEHHGVLEHLIGEAPRHLAAGGVLQIVVQRRVGVRAMLDAAFGAAETIAADGRYTVWRARQARPPAGRGRRQG